MEIPCCSVSQVGFPDCQAQGQLLTLRASQVVWSVFSDKVVFRDRVLTTSDLAAGFVTHFMEKPMGSRLESMAHASKHATPSAPFEASMGVYIFKRDVLVSLLHENEGHFGSDAGPDTHFGHDVMPHALREGFTVVAHHFDGYWRVRGLTAPTVLNSRPRISCLQRSSPGS